jgi:hypothetical protein
MDQLGASIDCQAGSFHQNDDLTVLAIELTGKPARSPRQNGTPEHVAGGA